MPKFMLACDFDRAKAKFPLIAQPKIDGIRGGNINKVMSARTLKPLGNRYTTLFFSQHAYRGFDGELAAQAETHARLCHLTQSATSTHEGEPWLMWHTFDYLTEVTINLPYIDRLNAMNERITELRASVPQLAAHLKPIPWTIVRNMDELDNVVEQHIELNYEGTITRKVDGKYKEGRCTALEGLLGRIKPFIHVDAIVSKLYEGERNNNEAQINELGNTFRSSHKENMVPNGMVGSMDAVLCEDVVHNKKVVHKAGETVKASAGRLTHAERAEFWEHPERLLQKRVKLQVFPVGIKDKARMATFQSFRSEEDTVET